MNKMLLTTCDFAFQKNLTDYCLFVSTDIYGAAHERASLQSLFHDAVELFGHVGQLKELSNTPREVLHGLQSVAPFQCFVRPVQPKPKSRQCVCASRLELSKYSHNNYLWHVWGSKTLSSRKHANRRLRSSLKCH